MDIQNVPKVGISSVVHSKHIDADSIDVIDNDIALFDSEMRRISEYSCNKSVSNSKERCRIFNYLREGW